MAFKKYIPSKERAPKKRAVVSVWKTGELKFSPAAVQKFSLAEFQFAELFYDEAARSLGIVPTNTKTEGALKLKRGRAGTTLRISGLLKKLGVNIDETVEKTVSRDKETGMLKIKLKSLGRGRRRKKLSE